MLSLAPLVERKLSLAQFGDQALDSGRQPPQARRLRLVRRRRSVLGRRGVRLFRRLGVVCLPSLAATSPRPPSRSTDPSARRAESSHATADTRASASRRLAGLAASVAGQGGN